MDDARNDWGLDRDSQRTGRQYTGIANVTMQDQAVTECMGAVVGHGREHLGPSDRMITRTRRRLLNAARAFRDTGAVPPGVDTPGIFHAARAGSFVHDPEVPLQAAYRDQLAKAVRWGAP